MCHINCSCSYAGYKFTQTKILSTSETFLKQILSKFLHSVPNIKCVKRESQTEVNSNPSNDIYIYIYIYMMSHSCNLHFTSHAVV